MENASKALIIAGAILISILLISVGIMIFNSSSGLFNSAKTSMSEQEISMFNQKFTMYESSNASGTQVKELVRAIKTNNTDSSNAKVGIGAADKTTITSTDTIDGTASGTAIVTTGRYSITCHISDSTGVVDYVTITKK